jgi:hypothetical protein
MVAHAQAAQWHTRQETGASSGFILGNRRNAGQETASTIGKAQASQKTWTGW